MSCNGWNHPADCNCDFRGGWRGGEQPGGGWYRRDGDRMREVNGPKRVPYVATFVNPNATCPVCGELVFYYQNEHGSRVFFDELGPPWPKHPCTDNDTYRLRGPKGQIAGGPTAALRLTSPHYRARKHSAECRVEFSTFFGHDPWPPFEVTEVRIDGDRALIFVRGLPPVSNGMRIFITNKASFLPQVGDLVFLNKGLISFFCPKRLSVVEHAVNVTTSLKERGGDKHANRRKRRKMSRMSKR